MLLRRLALLACLGSVPTAQENRDESRLSDEVIPLRTDLVPRRPRPILELGDPFLGTGELEEPTLAPTGAVLQPAFLVFGTFRSALQTFGSGSDASSEWASRLDLFGNLRFSGTERLLVGLRPLDEDGRFTRYVFEPGDERGWEGELDLELSTLFFEGDFGEIFPGLDRRDRGHLDYGFAVGRQQLTFQDGILIDDRIDALGVTRNSLLPAGTSNLRVTGLFGWNDIHRGDNVEDDDALLLGLFSEADLSRSTLSLDAVYTLDTDGGADDSDAVTLGLGAVQRLGQTNTTFRVLTSTPVHEESEAVRHGTLLFSELSRTLPRSDDLVYATGFWGLGAFRSAARSPEAGGPLGRTGVLFAAVGLGSYGAPLGNDADDSVGGALGWQSFLGDGEHRRQLILEAGARADTDSSQRDAVALGARLQQAMGKHTVLRFDAFVAGRENQEPLRGLRVELLVKF